MICLFKWMVCDRILAILLLLVHKFEYKCGLLRKLCYRTFSTQNQDPGHYLPFRRSAAMFQTGCFLLKMIKM